MFLELGVFLWIYMTLAFGFSVLKKRNDYADVAWGLGFIFLAWFAFFLQKNVGFFSYLINILISIWGLRLSFHIYQRLKNKPEDYRYAAWRANWQHFYLRSYFQIYMLQGCLLFIIALPIFFIQKRDFSSLEFFDFFSIFLWIFGFLFEAIADHQLKVFVQDKNNKGHIIQTGLWKYSRHPNYFGELVQWWAIFFLSLHDLSNFWLILSPLTISFLIVKVSGIPMLEKKYEKHPEFLIYKQKTSVLIPFFCFKK